MRHNSLYWATYTRRLLTMGNSVDLLIEPSMDDIDTALTYMRELLIDPKLTPRRRIIILNAIDNLLDDRLESSHLS